MMSRALIILADGFEEVEAVTPIDYLRRAGVEVVVAGMGSRMVMGAHGLGIEAGVDLADADGEFDALVLPGGMPGSSNLAKEDKVRELVCSQLEAGRIVAAICAAPAFVLAEACGVVNGKTVTGYPGTEEVLVQAGASTSSEKVVRDGNLITAQGPGTAAEFAMAIIEALEGETKAGEIARQTLVSD